MRLERKKEIRSLIKTIPQLIQAGLITQAFETEKIICATFDFSEEFLTKLGGIPQNHIEAIQGTYSDLLHKAYAVGYKKAQDEPKTVDMELVGDELDQAIIVEMPMPANVKNELVAMFNEGVCEYYKTIPDGLQETMVQFEKDLLSAYLTGIKDCLLLCSAEEKEVEKKDADEDAQPVVETIEPSDDPIAFDETVLEMTKEEVTVDLTAKVIATVWHDNATEDLKSLFQAQAAENKHRANAKMMIEFTEWLAKGNDNQDYIPDETYKVVVASTLSKELLTKLEEYAKLLGSVEKEKVLRYALGLGDKSKKVTAAAVDTAVPADPAMEKLEAYTKLLNNPEAEKILRYTLGLPITASVEITARQIGPYDTQALAAKVAKLKENHNYDTNEFQTLIVDCLVAEIHNLSDKDATKAIADKLQLKVTENTTLEEIEVMADDLAAELNLSTGLEGYFMFLPMESGDYCLTYNFDTPEEFVQKTQEPAPVKEDDEVTASIPKGPQGVLSKSEQAQIESLLTLGKSKTYKDIKKASPKLGVKLSKLLNDIRMSKISLRDGIKQLSASMDAMVEEAFGDDGLEYFRYLRSKQD